MSPVRVSTVFLAVAVVGAAAVGPCGVYDFKKEACNRAECEDIWVERKLVCAWGAQVFVEDGPSAVGRKVPDTLMTVKGQQMQVSTNVGVRDFPRFLEGTHFHAVERVPANGRLRFQCTTTTGGSACDFFVTVFSCGHCSGEVDGGLPELLTVTNGWEPRSCAPAMSVAGADGSAEQYKMKIFRVQVHPGQSAVTPRLPREAHFVAVFSSTEPTEYCPVPVRPVGPFPPMRNCGAKCPFERLG